MTPHLFEHVAVLCAGLAVAAAVALPCRRLLRRDPTACYRLFLALLLGALALVPVQCLVEGRAADHAPWLRDWIDRLVAPVRAEEPPPADSILVQAADPAPRGAAPVADSLAAAGSRETDTALGALSRGIPARTWGPALWLLGALAIGARRLGALRSTRRLARAARPVEDRALLDLWHRIASGSRVGRRTRLLRSDRIASPACFGWFRPVLFLPDGPRPLRRDVLEWALRHELVHLGRGDALVAAVQSFTTALLWFHPAAWWLSGEISRLRELSCDQAVIRDGRRRSYALALLEYAAANNGHSTADDAGPHSAGVRCALLHWSRSRKQIERRIEMLSIDEGPSRRRRWLGGAVALGAFIVPAAGQVAASATLLPAGAAACVACDETCPKCGKVKKQVAKAPGARPAPAKGENPEAVVLDLDLDGDLDVRLAELAKLELDLADLDVERIVEVEAARAVDEARRQAEVAAASGAHARGAVQEAAAALEAVRRSIGRDGDEAGRARSALLAEARLEQEVAESARRHAEDAGRDERRAAMEQALHEELLKTRVSRSRGDPPPAHAPGEAADPSHEKRMKELLDRFQGSAEAGDMAAAHEHARRWLEAAGSQHPRFAEPPAAAAAPAPDRPDRPDRPDPPDVPGLPGMLGARFANEHALIDRIQQLEAQIADLRAQLEEMRARRDDVRRDPRGAR